MGVIEGSERLKRNSRRLRRVFLALLVLTPFFTAFFWLGVADGDQYCLRHLPVVIKGELPTGTLFLGFLVFMVPAAFIMYALFVITRLFGLYEKGKVFGPENVACFRALGWTIIACDIADFLASVALGPILTYHLGDGYREMVIELDSNSFYTLLAGFSVLTIAWVMDEARKIKEEQELIV